MMKKEKSIKTLLLEKSIGSLLLIAAGLVLLFKPDFGSAAVAAVIGWSLIAMGVLGMVVSILSWPVFSIPEILLCVLGLGLGIYLVRNPLSLASILGLTLGVCLVVQGIGGLLDAGKLRRAGFGFVPDLVLALVMLGFGVLLLFFPLTASHLVMTLCGIVMIVCGVANLVLHARAAKWLRRESRKIIDAEE